MRRLILLILITALLGLATSLGVAWVIAGLQPEWASAIQAGSGRVGEWDVTRWIGRGQIVRSGIPLRDDDLEPASSSRSDGPEQFNDPPAFRRDELVVHAAGWPTRAWSAEWKAHPSRLSELGGRDLSGGLIIGRIPDAAWFIPAKRLLPLRPIWPSVILDVAFWWIVWLVVACAIAIPGVMRGRFRRRRNRCAVCGYDRRGHDAQACSECGAGRDERRPLLSRALVTSLMVVLLLLVVSETTVGVAVAKLHHGPYPIHLAARDGDLDGIKRALANGVDVDIPVDGDYYPKGSTPLMWAAAAGQLDAVRLLLQRGASVNAPSAIGETAFFFAADRGTPEVLARLAAAGADVDASTASDWSALYQAVFSGRIENVRAIIAAGANVNPSAKYSPIKLAIALRNAEIVRLLIAAGADIDDPSLVSDAVAGEMVDTLQLLLDLGAPHYETEDGWTPLHAAVEGGDAEVVRALVEGGLNPTVRYLDNRTPLEMAIDFNEAQGVYDEIIDILAQAESEWRILHPQEPEQ